MKLGVVTVSVVPQPQSSTSIRGRANGARVARGPAAGILAGLTGLGLGELAAGIADRASPVVSVGNSVIDHVPLSVKQFAISTFGSNDKQALIGGILVLTVVYAAVVGAVAVRRFAWGLAGVAGFAVIGLWAAVTGRTGDGGNAGPVLVAAAAAAVVLALLVRPWTQGRAHWPVSGQAPWGSDQARLSPSGQAPWVSDQSRFGDGAGSGPGLSAESMLPDGREAGLERRHFLIGSAGALGVAGFATLGGRSLQRNGKVVAARAKAAQG